jgi:ABC-type Fe3+ transport system permease subunit
MFDPLLIFLSAVALSALLGALIGGRWIDHVALCAAAIPPVYFAATMIMALGTGSRDSSARADIGVIAMGLIWPMAVRSLSSPVRQIDREFSERPPRCRAC